MPDLSLPQTRAEARALGVKRYFTGKPCRRGHIAARDVWAQYCTECKTIWVRDNTERVREYQLHWREKHPERALESDNRKHRRYRQAHPERRATASRHWRQENKEHVREYERLPYQLERRRKAANRRRQVHPERARDIRRRSYLKHPERALEYNRRQRLKHPERVRANNRNRRARLRGAPGTHTDQDVAALLVQQNGNCAYRHWHLPGCLNVLANGYDVDHIIPLSKGGSNDVANLQLLCGPCNSRKSNKDPSEFARENGALF